MKPVSIDDYRQLAQRRLPHFLFEYIDGGAVSESTLRRNVSDLQDIAVRQRVLRDGVAHFTPVARAAPVATTSSAARSFAIQWSPERPPRRRPAALERGRHV